MAVGRVREDGALIRNWPETSSSLPRESRGLSCGEGRAVPDGPSMKLASTMGLFQFIVHSVEVGIPQAHLVTLRSQDSRLVFWASNSVGDERRADLLFGPLPFALAIVHKFVVQ